MIKTKYKQLNKNLEKLREKVNQEYEELFTKHPVKADVEVAIPIFPDFSICTPDGCFKPVQIARVILRKKPVKVKILVRTDVEKTNFDLDEIDLNSLVRMLYFAEKSKEDNLKQVKDEGNKSK